MIYLEGKPGRKYKQVEYDFDAMKRENYIGGGTESWVYLYEGEIIKQHTPYGLENIDKRDISKMCNVTTNRITCPKKMILTMDKELVATKTVYIKDKGILSMMDMPTPIFNQEMRLLIKDAHILTKEKISIVDLGKQEVDKDRNALYNNGIFLCDYNGHTRYHHDMDHDELLDLNLREVSNFFIGDFFRHMIYECSGHDYSLVDKVIKTMEESQEREDLNFFCYIMKDNQEKTIGDFITKKISLHK